MNAFEIWPGPMEGVGRNEFVLAASALQLTDRWMTPFIRISDCVPSPGKIFKHFEAYLSCGLPVIVQIMGDDPAKLIKCSEILLTHPAVTGINLNMGCPSLRVIRHGSGGGLLKSPGKAAEFALRIAEALPPGKFSVKVRSGFADPADMEIFLPVLASSGLIAKIFFHYRTVAEGYSSAALEHRLERICRAVKLCGDVPLVANGDIADVAEARALVAQSGACGVMIARPWMSDPFLLRRFSGNTPDAPEGREFFFGKLKESGISGGALIEMARMLWGGGSERFRQVIREVQG